MKHFTTVINAIDPADGELKEWCGPTIEAISWTLADEYLLNNGMGYCTINGVLFAEVPVENGAPVWDKLIDYDITEQN
jgi:hypothetical protein